MRNRIGKVGLLVILSAPVFLTGCTWLIELAASGRTKVEKEFDLPSSKDLAGCIDSPTAACPLPSAGDFRPRALSTTFDRA
jgi:hypothetical protein